jgi:hypothetical protein
MRAQTQKFGQVDFTVAQYSVIKKGRLGNN